MSLISLTAAPRSRFLMRISSYDPSSCAFRHTSETERKCSDVRLGTRGEDRGRKEGERNDNLYSVNILFHLQVFGGRDARAWREMEKWRGVKVRCALPVQGKQHWYITSSLARMQNSRRWHWKSSESSLRGHRARCCPLGQRGTLGHPVH